MHRSEINFHGRTESDPPYMVHSSQSVGIHIWYTLASGRRQMAQEHYDRPKFIVAQSSLGAGHSGWSNSVIEDPLQLTVRKSLHVWGSQRWDRGRNMINERNSCILPIHAVAGDTVMREGLLAVSPRLRRVRQRVLLLFIADKKMMFGRRYDFCLEFPRGLALQPASPTRKIAAIAVNRDRISNPPRAASISSNRDQSRKIRHNAR